MMRWLLALLVLVLSSMSASAFAQEGRDEAWLRGHLNLLRTSAVTSDDFVRVELFSWAASAPPANEPFLRDTASSGGPYQRALERVAVGTSEEASLARLLASDPERRRRRFAWTTPMGTAVPLGPRSYGPELIRITLEEDSFFLHFTPEQSPAFQAVDGEEHEVALADVLAHPERIASVFHEQASIPMREFIVHGRVRSFAVNTDDIANRVTLERSLLASMQAWSRTHPGGAAAMAPHWTTRLPSDANPFAIFAACMPFDTARHRPTTAGLRALSRALSRNLRVALRHVRRDPNAIE